MRRVLVLTATIACLPAVAAACGSEPGDALDTLPPMITTTTTTTTTVPVDGRRKFYEVKAGDNIAEIARSFEVPASEIVRINNLPDDGQIIQVGQVLEIPLDVVLVDELPTTSSASSTSPP